MTLPRGGVTAPDPDPAPRPAPSRRSAGAAPPAWQRMPLTPSSPWSRPA